MAVPAQTNINASGSAARRNGKFAIRILSQS